MRRSSGKKLVEQGVGVEASNIGNGAVGVEEDGYRLATELLGKLIGHAGQVAMAIRDRKTVEPEPTSARLTGDEQIRQGWPAVGDHQLARPSVAGKDAVANSSRRSGL
jgi:hypothetical protein